MNPSSDMDSAASAGSAAVGSTDGSSLPPTWYEAILSILASRVALIQIEFQEAARNGAKRACLILAVIGCVFFGWLLLLAGGVQLLAVGMQWPWYWVAIGLALIHLLLALVLVKLAKPPTAPAFSFTRAEFKKDREWIEQLKNNKRSNG